MIPPGRGLDVRVEDPDLHRYWVERERYEGLMASRNWWRTFAFIVLGSNLLGEVVTFFNR